MLLSLVLALELSFLPTSEETGLEAKVSKEVEEPTDDGYPKKNKRRDRIRIHETLRVILFRLENAIAPLRSPSYIMPKLFKLMYNTK